MQSTVWSPLFGLTGFFFGGYKMNKNENATITTVAKINKTNILVIEKNGEKRIAIKPICEALGVDFSGQLQRI